MRVKNIAVLDVEEFLDVLVKYLILNEISYVQIDNEFHFSNNIYRVFDYNDKEAMKELNNSLVPLIIGCSPEALINIEDTLNFKRCNNNLVNEKKNNLKKIEQEKKTYSKKLVKAHNRMINQVIKNSKR